MTSIAKVIWEGEYFRLDFVSGEFFGPRYVISEKKMIPFLNDRYVDYHRFTTDNGVVIDEYYPPTDMSEIEEFGKLSNMDLRRLEDTDRNQYAMEIKEATERLADAKKSAALINTIVWVAAVGLLIFSFGLSLLVLFALRTTKLHESALEAAIDKSNKHAERQISWRKTQRNAAKEYLLCLEKIKTLPAPATIELMPQIPKIQEIETVDTNFVSTQAPSVPQAVSTTDQPKIEDNGFEQESGREAAFKVMIIFFMSLMGVVLFCMILHGLDSVT